MVAFRTHTLLSLDGCFYALHATLPYLTRSAVHRCLQRHGLSRLPDREGAKPQKKQFKPYPIGYFHIDMADVRTEEGQLSLFVAIDRTCKVAYSERHPEAMKTIVARCLRNLIAAIPYTIYPILTANGMELTDRQRDQYAFPHT